MLKKLYKQTSNERQILFGLSSAHAAATIAIILVGYLIGLVNINILNATLPVIFLSCMTSALVTDRAAKMYAIANPVSRFNLLISIKYLYYQLTRRILKD